MLKAVVRLRLYALLMLVPIFSTAAICQNSTSAVSPPRGTSELGLWAGYSPRSFTFNGTAQDRKLFLLNLYYARVLMSRRLFTLKYTFEVVPLALQNQPTEFFVFKGRPLITNRARTIYGAGLSPIGFQANLGHRRIQPFMNGSVGFLYFADQVPIIDSSQFNFSFTAGAGLQFFPRANRTFSIGLKYHHISNAETAPLNPGIDSKVFYAGFSIFRRR
jgi:Lipid A 3-O-deacylase (PagL)